MHDARTIATTDKNGQAITGFWNVDADLPKVGETVKCHRFGEGIVEEHILIEGWIGFMVNFKEPPKWFVEQEGGNRPALQFGVDLNV